MIQEMPKEACDILCGAFMRRVLYPNTGSDDAFSWHEVALPETAVSLKAIRELRPIVVRSGVYIITLSDIASLLAVEIEQHQFAYTGVRARRGR